MKAFLLAAGFGTRLKPLTDTIPKCMVLIHDKPLLEWWMELFVLHGISEVLVNTHYRPEQIRTFISQYNTRNTGITVREFFEPVLLGSGGTVGANRNFITTDEPFLICYADNLTNINLTKLRYAHETSGALLTMSLFRTNRPKECGIAELDAQGKIIDFVEKPANPKSNLANAGIYVANKAIFDSIPKNCFVDFGKDVLGALIGRMHGWEMDDYLIDIGTLENYHRAQREWQK